MLRLKIVKKPVLPNILTGCLAAVEQSLNPKQPPPSSTSTVNTSTTCEEENNTSDFFLPLKQEVRRCMRLLCVSGVVASVTRLLKAAERMLLYAPTASSVKPRWPKSFRALKNGNIADRRLFKWICPSLWLYSKTTWFYWCNTAFIQIVISLECGLS